MQYMTPQHSSLDLEVKAAYALVSVSSQMAYQVLEDECEGAVCVDDVMQCHDVGVLQVLQQGHCGAQGGGLHTHTHRSHAVPYHPLHWPATVITLVLVW